jgi:hypothetical protein
MDADARALSALPFKVELRRDDAVFKVAAVMAQ